MEFSCGVQVTGSSVIYGFRSAFFHIHCAGSSLLALSRLTREFIAALLFAALGSRQLVLSSDTPSPCLAELYPSRLQLLQAAFPHVWLQLPPGFSYAISFQCPFSPMVGMASQCFWSWAPQHPSLDP